MMPFAAELARLDTAGMAAGPPPGYDPDFDEPILVDTDGDGVGVPLRRELPPIRVRCQVEPQLLEDQVQTAGGNVPRSRMGLVFHYRELERRGLVDETSGEALIRPGDRLVAIYDVRGQLVQAMRTPLYVTEARPIGFGLSSRRPLRNLLLCVLEDRPQGSRRV
jgi:hypothetical protein